MSSQSGGALFRTNLSVIGLGVLLMVSLFDVAVHLVGLGWFAGPLNPYTIANDLVIVLGIAYGAVSLFARTFVG
jgi:hypothetical protein